jgi:hypothetical protein
LLLGNVTPVVEPPKANVAVTLPVDVPGVTTIDPQANTADPDANTHVATKLVTVQTPPLPLPAVNITNGTEGNVAVIVTSRSVAAVLPRPIVNDVLVPLTIDAGENADVTEY